MEYVHAKQLSTLLVKQILQELKLEKQRFTPNETRWRAPLPQGRALELLTKL